MNRTRRTAIAVLSAVIVITALRVAATKTAVTLGPKARSLEECAVHQKYLYQSVEAYRREHNRLPASIDDIHHRDAWVCPASGKGYTLHLENYGKPDAVVIAEKRNAHPTTFAWWFRWLKPQVQTMGDGTIQLFKGGKVATMSATKPE